VSADRHVSISGVPTHIENESGKGRDTLSDDVIKPPLSARRLWLHRVAVLLFVFFCAILGVVLIIFPWRDEWTTNNLLLGHPGLQNFLASGFVRGLCSGLGVLDIWIGFWEAIHYHE
jgi:hypothetical protein